MDGRDLEADALDLAQAFADVATLVIVRPGSLTDTELSERITRALEGRVVIERAKGALAQLDGLDMAAAHTALVAEAQRDSLPLTDAAHGVLRRAQGAGR